MEKVKDTAAVLQELNNVTTLSSGLNVINLNDSNFNDISFSDFFNKFLSKHPGIKLASIIKDSGLSRQYAHQILNGERSGSRDRIIALCFSAGMNLDEINHALIYAKHPALYAKNKRDALIILAINSKQRGSKEYITSTDLSIFLDEQNQPPLDI